MARVVDIYSDTFPVVWRIDSLILVLVRFYFAKEKMPYQFIILGDSNVVRFWEAAQTARPQLLGVSLKPVNCIDTLASALSELNEGFDYALVSVLTSMLLEEASSADIKNSCGNIIRDVVRLISSAAIKSKRVEVFV